ncbi:MAG: SDR family NAD(P)-dependent oxidoreductase, partial [Halopseudomonas aestusnigri]
MLSARSQDRLLVSAHNLASFLETNNPSLVDLAYTLQTGRVEMKYRVAFEAESVDEARIILKDFSRRKSTVAHCGLADGSQALDNVLDEEDTNILLDKWLSTRRLDKLAAAWVRGMKVDWIRMLEGMAVRRLALPIYPFGREKIIPVESCELSVAADNKTELPDWGPLAYATGWEIQKQIFDVSEVTPGAILVVAPESMRQAAVNASVWYGESVPNAVVIHITLGDETRQVSETEWVCNRDDTDCFMTCLQDQSTVGTVLIFAGQSKDLETVNLDAMSSDEVQLLRLAQVLEDDLAQAACVDLYVITPGYFPLAPDAPSIGSGLAGLAYALAQGEPRFKVRNLDVDVANLLDGDGQEIFWPSLLAEPADERGGLVRISSGGRFRQTFHPLDWGGLCPGGIKQGGVYVLIGGAGVVGRLLTQHLIASYDAKVIWIGRRPADDPGLKHHLDGFGEELLYLQGDVSDATSLNVAVTAARHHHGNLDGVFLMAMDAQNDGPALDLTSEIFAHQMKVKTMGAVNVLDVFANVPLDFLCAFSSVQAFSFLSAKESAAYATSTVFADSYLRNAKAGFPVGIVHWGYWQASIAGTELETELAPHFSGLKVGEAWDFLERFLDGLSRGFLSEAICLKASKDVRALMPCREPLQVDTDAGLPFLNQFDVSKITTITSKSDWKAPEIWIRKLLIAQLRKLGLFTETGRWKTDDLRRKCQVLEGYRLWWSECLTGMLDGQDLLSQHDDEVEVRKILSLEEVDSIWQSWDAAKDEFFADPQRAPALKLAEDCLRQLPDVLTGAKSPSEVIFPGGSMDKVAKLYSGTTWTDSFNVQVADTIEAYIRHRLSSNPKAQIRILEIGAGTGGTTAQILPRLNAMAAPIQEYCYTDVSDAFLIQARQRWATEYSYLRTSRCDIEQPLKEQDITEGVYDLVIATNCLHATRDMRETIAHARSALCGHGLMIVNEGVDKGLLITLIFGLLEGWWRYRDADLRISGSPLLNTARWKHLLGEAGLRTTVLGENRGDSQQVILAENSGLVSKSLVLDRKPEDKLINIENETSEGAGFEEEAVITKPQTVKDILRNCLAEVLSLNASSITGNVPFSDYGIDSILSVSFVNRLNIVLGIELNRSIIYDFANLDKLSKHIEETQSPQITQPKKVTSSPSGVNSQESSSVPTSSDIAVIGMALQTPEAPDLETFWKNLSNGRGSHTGGLEEKDCFDPAFFGLSDSEAKAMNPHQRLIMQEGWKAFEDAGVNPQGLAGSRTGIFIGAESSNWYQGSFTGASDAIIAARLSYLLDLKGPALVINTGCSSSGTAIYLACESLRRGETDLALAGGVAASLSEDTLNQLRETGMLSPSNECRSFTNDADGMVLSEAVGAVVLKRYGAAIADGDPIHGVITAYGMNQDGTSNGITAPNGKAQEDLLSEVWRNFSIDPETLSHFEVHGTGTLLGDAVEGNALTRAFRKLTDKQGFCQLGLTKSLLGHTGAASGVVGLIKLMLCIRHRFLPGPEFTGLPNSMLEMEGSALVLPADGKDWSTSAGRPLCAGLNVFGHSGTNVHFVVQEAGHSNLIDIEEGPVLIPLSATTKTQLHDVVRRLLSWIDQRADPNLSEIAITCQIGRAALGERVAFLVESIEALRIHLTSFLDGQVSETAVWRGRASENETKYSGSNTWEGFGEAWVQGASVDWIVMWQGESPQRCHLPFYPFAQIKLAPDGEGLRYQHTKTVAASSYEVPRDNLVGDSADNPVLKILAHRLKQPAKTLSRHASWRDLGTDSRVLIGFALDLEKAFGREIKPSLLFEYPTPAKLAAHLSIRGLAIDDQFLTDTKGSQVTVPISDLTLDAVILSCVQQGLWSLQVGRPSMTAYNVPLGLRVPKDVS